MDDTQGRPAPENTATPASTAETAQGDEAVLSELERSLTESEEAEGAAGDGQATDGQSEDEELEELEVGGRRAKIPKWLKPELEKGRDYTKKTMAVSERNKELDAREAQIKADSEWRRDNFDKVADLRHLDRQLKGLESLTREQWAEIEAKNPQKAASLTREMTLLRSQRDRLAGDLQQSAQQKAHETQQETAKRLETSLARIAKEIPSWNDELAGKLTDYGVENGFSLEDLEEMRFHPSRVKNLHKAYLFDQLMARTRAKPKPESAPAVVVPTVSAARKAPTAKDPNKMSPEEYRTWRMNGGGSTQAAAR